MPAPPRPQTRRCRFADQRGQCRSIATHGEVCGRHVRALEEALAPEPSIVSDLLTGLFGGPVAQASMARAGDAIAAKLDQWGQAAIDRLTHGASSPAASAPPPAPRARPSGPPPPQPKAPPSPEAVARRRKVIESCALLGLDADGQHTEEAIRRAHRGRAKLCHVDGQPPDPHREEMLRQVNAANEFLIWHVRDLAQRRAANPARGR